MYAILLAAAQFRATQIIQFLQTSDHSENLGGIVSPITRSVRGSREPKMRSVMHLTGFCLLIIQYADDEYSDTYVIYFYAGILAFLINDLQLQFATGSINFSKDHQNNLFPLVFNFSYFVSTKRFKNVALSSNCSYKLKKEIK